MTEAARPIRRRRTQAEIAKANAARARAHEKMVIRTYGLAPGEYDRMLEAQGGVCAICKKAPRAKHLSVDHDHNTGRVRALLCQPCNRAIGRFEFEYLVAVSAAAYLEAIAEDYTHAQSHQGSVADRTT